MMNYHEYLQSPEWKTKRDIVVKNFGGRCATCCSSVKLNVHHRKYDKMQTEEEIHDLVCLCEFCHTSFHRLFDIKNGRMVRKKHKTKRKKQNKKKRKFVKGTPLKPKGVKSLANRTNKTAIWGKHIKQLLN